MTPILQKKKPKSGLSQKERFLEYAESAEIDEKGFEGFFSKDLSKKR